MAHHAADAAVAGRDPERDIVSEGRRLPGAWWRVNDGVLLPRGGEPLDHVVCRFDLPAHCDAAEVAALEVAKVTQSFERFVTEVIISLRVTLSSDLAFLADGLPGGGGTRLEILVRRVDADADLESGTAD